MSHLDWVAALSPIASKRVVTSLGSIITPHKTFLDGLGEYLVWPCMASKSQNKCLFTLDHHVKAPEQVEIRARSTRCIEEIMKALHLKEEDFVWRRECNTCC
jgi:hypothetical protein